MYEKSRHFDKIGFYFILMLIISILCHVLAICYKKVPEGTIGSFAIANLSYLIIAPIVGVRIKKEIEVNRENVSLLTEFLVLNECADDFMNVNTEEIERELDAAHDVGEVI